LNTSSVHSLDSDMGARTERRGNKKMATIKKEVAKEITKEIKEVAEVEFIETPTYEETITEDILIEETITKVEPKIFKNMEIGGVMVRVSDHVVINALPFEKNPFEIISNEEVKSEDGKMYPISILQRHSFKVITDQTKAPRVANQGIIKLAPLGSVIPTSGIPSSSEKDIEFVN